MNACCKKTVERCAEVASETATKRRAQKDALIADGNGVVAESFGAAALEAEHVADKIRALIPSAPEREMEAALPAEYASEGERDRLALVRKYAYRALRVYGASPAEVEHAIRAAPPPEPSATVAVPRKLLERWRNDLGGMGDAGHELEIEVEALLGEGK